MLTFHDVFDRVIGHEAGYVNDPNDPGGETKWGISKRTYPDLNIASLTRDDARLIYRRDFWNAVSGDRVVARGFDGVAYAMMDFAFHSGIRAAIRGMQRAVGVVDDGKWGPQSTEAALKMTEAQLIMRLTAQRLRFMVQAKGWKFYSAGWANRIAANLELGAGDIG